MSGGAFVIDGNDNFGSPKSYSGGFESWSISVQHNGATVTGFHAYSESCDAWGIKIGARFSGVKDKAACPIGISYSRSNYSKPYILEM